MGESIKIDFETQWVVEKIHGKNQHWAFVNMYLLENCIFWDIIPRSPLKISRRLGRTCHLHLLDKIIGQGLIRAGAVITTAVRTSNTIWYWNCKLHSRLQWPRSLRHEVSSFALSNTGIVGSNSARGMEACIAFILYLSSSVWVAALWQLIAGPRSLSADTD
jgi:hypothetical protein